MFLPMSDGFIVRHMGACGNTAMQSCSHKIGTSYARFCRLAHLGAGWRIAEWRMHSPPIGRSSYSLTTITTVPVGESINPLIVVTSKPRMTALSVDTVNER